MPPSPTLRSPLSQVPGFTGFKNRRLLPPDVSESNTSLGKGSQPQVVAGPQNRSKHMSRIVHSQPRPGKPECFCAFPCTSRICALADTACQAADIIALSGLPESVTACVCLCVYSEHVYFNVALAIPRHTRSWPPYPSLKSSCCNETPSTREPTRSFSGNLSAKVSR